MGSEMCIRDSIRDQSLIFYLIKKIKFFHKVSIDFRGMSNFIFCSFQLDSMGNFWIGLVFGSGSYNIWSNKLILGHNRDQSPFFNFGFNKKKSNFTTCVQICHLCIADPDRNFFQVIVTGWGSLQKGGVLSDTLMEVRTHL